MDEHNMHLEKILLKLLKNSFSNIIKLYIYIYIVNYAGAPTMITCQPFFNAYS